MGKPVEIVDLGGVDIVGPQWHFDAINALRRINGATRAQWWASGAFINAASGWATREVLSYNVQDYALPTLAFASDTLQKAQWWIEIRDQYINPEALTPIHVGWTADGTGNVVWELNVKRWLVGGTLHRCGGYPNRARRTLFGYRIQSGGAITHYDGVC